MSDAHSTNYFNTFIAVSEDCPASLATDPPTRASPSVAELTFQMISQHPYEHTSDDVIFGVWAVRRGIASADLKAARTEFFSKGQPCLRASDLGKRYGWGVHADADGKVALFAMDTPEYSKLAGGQSLSGQPITVRRAMRSSRR